jgi:hypothetical protein
VENFDQKLSNDIGVLLRALACVIVDNVKTLTRESPFSKVTRLRTTVMADV